MRLNGIVILALITHVAVAQVSPHGALKIPCQACHATDSWAMKKDAEFKHESVGFALTGRHQMTPCASCHKDLKFTKMSTNCTSCHTDVHRSELGANCFKCHTTKSWQVPDMVPRHQQTSFPLVGKHQTVDCRSCHVNASEHHYVGTPTTCIGCHRVDYETTKEPDHRAAQFSTNCVQCHQVTALQWKSSFDHALTRFPLTGTHKSSPCAACHLNNVFGALPTDCVSCHRSDYQQAQNPNHASANFPTMCQTCHTTIQWRGATFNHSATRFPLTGAHVTLQCQFCHTNGNYQLVYTECYQCHQTQFQQAANPNHVSGNFSHDCTGCHSTASWSGATFNHNTTLFPLTGAHVATPCQSCHLNGNYQLHYTDCYQCHQSDFQQTTNPNHVTGNFSHTCTQCHSTTAWSPATFNHASTAFPLTGAHTTASCQSCHVNGNYQLHYTDCYQCHQSDFQGVTNPNHVTQMFNHTCSPCHNTSVWTPNTMNHDSNWFRIYSGKHRNKWTQCSQCHLVPGNLTSFNCATACHQNAHNQGQNCYGCHRNV